MGMPLSKDAETAPVAGLFALTQTIIGIGAGLLIADRLDEKSRNRAAIALIGAGVATSIPFIAGIISAVANKPGSARRARKQLASIRGDSGFPHSEGVL